ncbi:DUF2512 family protein [Desulfofundulus thermobenzoicus]|uniref:DUF2512 family protein n=1 Tax=Desulfofundulus thermobenzoicus TaxID=29376 RepID=A0A6N7ISN2_9FIRM|nr:DUF2512 family protein [Desulfofundulus thermobenzoicus]MQL53084.1 DUF2512 family protein [Desulfofundulus thermobenzoicus]
MPVARHINALITKFLLFAPVMGVLLPAFSSLNVAEAIMTALLMTPVVYILADVIVLPRQGTWAAMAADIIVTILLLWEATTFLGEKVLAPPGTVLVAATIGAGEWYFHQFLLRTLFNRRGREK